MYLLEDSQPDKEFFSIQPFIDLMRPNHIGKHNLLYSSTASDVNLIQKPS